jgi:hypothetical protein
MLRCAEGRTAVGTREALAHPVAKLAALLQAAVFVVLMMALSGCVAWTTCGNCGECGACGQGPLRTIVNKVRTLEIPCAIVVPQPSWARNHRAKPEKVPEADILLVRGRFHAVPTRPVFAPKHELVLDRGEPTPAPQAVPEQSLPAPMPMPQRRQRGPLQRPNAAPTIPMMAPPEKHSASATSEPMSDDAVTLAVEVVEEEPEEGPLLQPQVELATRPMQDAWQQRSSKR